MSDRDAVLNDAVLNRECFCITLDGARLLSAIRAEAQEPDLVAAMMAARPNLFSSGPVFISKHDLALMLDVVAAQRQSLSAVPQTVLVTADELWGSRKRHFFKPAGGRGGKAVYRGDKITRGVWEEVRQGGYIAQALAAPSERRIKIDGELKSLKLDVRLYTYKGSAILTAARVYQGQTTNFRTPGGGFAPVFIV